MADADYSGITNPKRVIAKREASAGVDKGDLPGPGAGMLEPQKGMSQAQFSKYPDGPKKGPPADLLKKHMEKP